MPKLRREYYDLNHLPITCPKCEAPFQAAQPAPASQRASAVIETGAAAELVSLGEGGEDKTIPVMADDDVEIEADDDLVAEEEDRLTQDAERIRREKEEEDDQLTRDEAAERIRREQEEEEDAASRKKEDEDDWDDDELPDRAPPM
jgi:hypothetical protein